MKTLCIDVGGTGLKCAVVDEEGALLCERARVKTPRPATPENVVMALGDLIGTMPEYDRVSVGFPGVVAGGVVKTAPNLDGPWKDFELAVAIAELTDKPTRAANDADVAGLAVVEGRGVELLLTLGTGVGAGLYLDGRLVPNPSSAITPFARTPATKTTCATRSSSGSGRSAGTGGCCGRWNSSIRSSITGSST
jgi:polyphosphate glucokinase